LQNDCSKQHEKKRRKTNMNSIKMPAEVAEEERKKIVC
jgi:hypothetical protein